MLAAVVNTCSHARTSASRRFSGGRATETRSEFPQADTTCVPNRSSQLRSKADNRGTGASDDHSTSAGRSALRRAGTSARRQSPNSCHPVSRRRATVRPAACAAEGLSADTAVGGASPGQFSNGGPGSCGQGSTPSGTSSGTGFDQNGSLRRRYSANPAASTGSRRIASASARCDRAGEPGQHSSGNSPVISRWSSRRPHNPSMSSGSSFEIHSPAEPGGSKRPGGRPSGKVIVTARR